jgi:cobalt-precorrin-5B (C1)-methyltransferase
MIGKLSKMADGKTMTHAAGSEVNMELLAEIAASLGAREEVVAEIRAANTARHVLEVAQREGVVGLPSALAARAAGKLAAHAGGSLDVQAILVDFDGIVLGRHPEEAR